MALIVSTINCTGSINFQKFFSFQSLDQNKNYFYYQIYRNFTSDSALENFVENKLYIKDFEHSTHLLRYWILNKIINYHNYLFKG